MSHNFWNFCANDNFQCLVTGSYPIIAAHNLKNHELWKAADIDVFLNVFDVDDPRISQVCELLRIENLNTTKLSCYFHNKTMGSKRILFSGTRTFSFASSVNLTVVQVNDLSKFIADEFDFTICTTMTDGQTCFIPHRDDFLNLRSAIQTFCHENRKKKYSARGITFYCNKKCHYCHALIHDSNVYCLHQRACMNCIFKRQLLEYEYQLKIADQMRGVRVEI